MRSGDVIFVRGYNVISKLIRFFDKGRFSHVCIAVSPTHILEAEYGTTARIVPFTYDDYEIVDIGLTDEQRDKVVHFGIQHIGKKYDIKLIIWFLLMSTFKMKGKNLLNDPNYLICSELVDVLLHEVGGYEHEMVGGRTPNELYEYLKLLTQK